MRRNKCPPAHARAHTHRQKRFGQKFKLVDSNEKNELPIKAVFARKAASNNSPLKFGNRVLIRAIS